MQRQIEAEMEAQTRRCFFVADVPHLNTAATKFRKLWDVLQVGVLGYVAIAVPYRMCFMVEVETISDPWFWWDVFVSPAPPAPALPCSLRLLP